MMLGQATTRSEESSHRSGLRIAVLLLLLCLTALAMGRVLGNDFTWFDDDWTIHHNPRLQPVTWGNILWYWCHADGDLFVPVTWSAWSLLALVAQSPQPDAYGICLDPAVFHAASLMLHGINVTLLYVILRRMFPSGMAACIGALAFAVHPVQVEAVAWASGLKDLLACCCAFLFLLVGLPALSSAHTRRLPPHRWMMYHDYWKAVGILIMGMLCKPSVMVAPLVAAALDWSMHDRRLGRSIALLGTLMLPLIPLIVVARLNQLAPQAASFPLHLRPLVAADTLAFYMGKIVWPMRLSVDYGRRPSVAWDQGWLLWTWIWPALVVFAAGMARRKVPWYTAGVLVFVAATMPVLGLVRFDFQRYSTVADHYLYTAMPGVSLAIAGLLSVPGPSWFRVTALIGVLVAVLTWTVLSAVQMGTWRDDRSLWTHAVNTQPDGVLANLNYGAMLLRESPDQLSQAVAVFRRAVRLDPESQAAHDSLAVGLLQMGAVDEAVLHMKETIRIQEGLHPGTIPGENRLEARLALARLCLQLHRPGEAIAYFQQALKLAPDDPAALAGLRDAMAQSANPAQP